MHEIRICKPETGKNVIYLNDNMLDSSCEVIRKTQNMGPIFIPDVQLCFMVRPDIPCLLPSYILVLKGLIFTNYLLMIFDSENS